MDEKELIKKYGIDIEAIMREQIKLSKLIVIKDSQDFSLIDKFGAIDSIIVKNKIISAVIVCDRDFNILEQQYFVDKLKFPYLNEFRSYRELPALIEAFSKLIEKPQILFVRGHGLTHPRLGLASHFSLAVNTPCIGIADSLFETTRIDGEDILKDGKVVGKLVQTKPGSNPLYVSVGNGISLNSALELTKKMLKLPHKLPEPLHMVHKYVRSINEELNL